MTNKNLKENLLPLSYPYDKYSLLYLHYIETSPDRYSFNIVYRESPDTPEERENITFNIRITEEKFPEFLKLLEKETSWLRMSTLDGPHKENYIRNELFKLLNLFWTKKEQTNLLDETNNNSDLDTSLDDFSNDEVDPDTLKTEISFLLDKYYKLRLEADKILTSNPEFLKHLFCSPNWEIFVWLEVKEFTINEDSYIDTFLAKLDKKDNSSIINCSSAHESRNSNLIRVFDYQWIFVNWNYSSPSMKDLTNSEYEKARIRQFTLSNSLILHDYLDNKTDITRDSILDYLVKYGEGEKNEKLKRSVKEGYITSLPVPISIIKWHDILIKNVDIDFNKLKEIKTTIELNIGFLEEELLSDSYRSQVKAEITEILKEVELFNWLENLTSYDDYCSEVYEWLQSNDPKIKELLKANNIDPNIVENIDQLLELSDNMKNSLFFKNHLSYNRVDRFPLRAQIYFPIHREYWKIGEILRDSFSLKNQKIRDRVGRLDYEWFNKFIESKLSQFKISSYIVPSKEVAQYWITYIVVSSFNPRDYFSEKFLWKQKWSSLTFCLDSKFTLFLDNPIIRYLFCWVLEGDYESIPYNRDIFLESLSKVLWNANKENLLVSNNNFRLSRPSQLLLFNDRELPQLLREGMRLLNECREIEAEISSISSYLSSSEVVNEFNSLFGSYISHIKDIRADNNLKEKEVKKWMTLRFFKNLMSRWFTEAKEQFLTDYNYEIKDKYSDYE